MAKFRLVVLVLLFLVSLLTVFKAPTYHLWLMAIAVAEYPLIWVLLTGVLLLAGICVKKYNTASFIIGVLAIGVFLSPIVRAYVISSGLKQNFYAAFGKPPASPNSGADSPFSFGKLFSRQQTPLVAHKTLKYNNELTLDFYPSQLAGAKPCVVVIHGGSWSSGDSGQLPELNSYLANLGYNVAAINYHLAPKYKSPLAINDVKQCFAYLRNHAAELNIDTTNFVLLGRSAGAQIALLSAYTQHEPGLKGVIDFYGPADMVWGYAAPASKWVMDSRAVMERYLGGTYSAMPQQYKASSPIIFVNTQSVPTLIIHGQNDVLVSPGHSDRLSDTLKKNNIKHFYLNMPWATHGFDYNINGPGGQLSTYVVKQFLNTVVSQK